MPRSDLYEQQHGTGTSHWPKCLDCRVEYDPVIGHRCRPVEKHCSTCTCGSHS